MNRHFILSLAIACIGAARADYDGAWRYIPGYSLQGGWQMRDAYSSETRTWSNDLGENTTSGAWAFKRGATNETDGGSATFTRGKSGDTELYIHGNMKGYIASVVSWSSPLESSKTRVIADPGVTLVGSQRAILLWDDSNGTRSHGSWTFEGGTYIGGDEAMLVENATDLVLDSVSFISDGDGKAAVHIRNASSLTITNSRERGDILYQGSDSSDGVGGAGLILAGGNATLSGGGSFIAGAGKSDSLAVNVEDNISGNRASPAGAAGAVIAGSTKIDGSYRFAGNEAGHAVAGGDASEAWAYGGHGAAFIGGANGTLSNSMFHAGAGSVAEIVKVSYLTGPETYVDSAENASAIAHGGSGFWAGAGTLTLVNSKGYGGAGGRAIADEAGSYADASGGNGVYTLGSLTIDGGEYVGARGGSARSREGEAYAFGGSGVLSRGANQTVTIHDGTFIAGQSGKVNDETFADGAGVTIASGTLNIHGGTFQGTGSTKSMLYGNALWVEDSNLTVTESSAETLIDGNVLLWHNTGKNAVFEDGTINGNLYKVGNGTTTLSISTNTTYSGKFIQDGGQVNVNLASSEESKFFHDVDIISGSMNFKNQTVVTAQNSVFMLGNGGTVLTFEQGGQLSRGTSIVGGYSQIRSSGGSLVMDQDSRIDLSYDALSGSLGRIDITGSSLMMKDGAVITLQGVADTPVNSIEIVSGGPVSAGSNAAIHADLGWLVSETPTVSANSIRVDTAYNSLTNTSLADLGAVLVGVDAVLQGLTNSQFYALNALGEADGDKLLRYPLSQMPDAAESSVRMSQKLNQQIAARGTEFRSMNGFASTKPRFENAPSGAAGPKAGTGEEKEMQGWVRAYGGTGSRDADGHFAEYDSTTWGTVVGLDKSFGNLLLGIAGGFSRLDIDAGTAYQSNIDTYHGSLYSTIGSEASFLDIALTFGLGHTEEENWSLMEKGAFDSRMFSAYLGTGYSLDLGEKISLTPEASFLASFYDQDAYTRSSILGDGTIKEYDTSSYLGAVGFNLATQHQIDWLYQGIACMPELRAHYIHEFNADPDDFTYVIGGTPTPFAVRPRDENLLRVGLGLDLWNWRYQDRKFEIDYDALVSGKYFEHVVSGKATFRF